MSRILVLGGARSGKSTHAEGLLSAHPVVDYVAPGNKTSPDDPEWAVRVAAHRARRPAGWRTHETRDLPPLLAAAGTAPVLVDCLSTWLAGRMDDLGVWAGERGELVTREVSGGELVTREVSGDTQLADAVDAVVEAWAATARQVVGVSSEVGFGIVPATASGRRFRDELGRLNARVAAVSDEVWLVVAGIPTRLK